MSGARSAFLISSRIQRRRAPYKRKKALCTCLFEVIRTLECVVTVRGGEEKFDGLEGWRG